MEVEIIASEVEEEVGQYQGSVQDIMANRDTQILAVAFKLESKRATNLLDIDISDEKLTNKHIEFVGYNDVTYLIAKGIREADLMPVLIIHSFDTQTLEPGDVLLRQNLLNSTEGFKHTIEPECKLWKQHGNFIYFYLVQNSLE
jgi:hypothetical protein